MVLMIFFCMNFNYGVKQRNQYDKFDLEENVESHS
jgi:hypothetical protein